MRRGLLMGALVALVAGCSSTRLDGVAPVEDRLSGSPGSAGGSATGPGGATGPVGSAQGSESRVASVDLGQVGSGPEGGGLEGAGAAPATQRVIYFDFDSFAVKDEYRAVVDHNARMLNADRKRLMLIEGHTDDRGGREYNLALGQKRADAVVRALTLLGAQDAQIEAVSYGEERPAAAGSTEAAWARNRRAELKDR
jgi:peptidoglycan-associated lipoprotein